MRIPRIYLPEADTSGLQLALPDGAFGHLVRVLRMNDGAALEVFNGRGRRFSAELVSVGKRDASVQILDALPSQTASPLHTHLGLVLSKGDRFDYALQKATELGVSAITPLTSERCDLKLKADRQEKKVQHWQGVLASACEQCGQDRLPELGEIQSLETWVAAQDSALKLVLHTSAEKPDFPEASPASVSFLIGPEGGLTDLEVAAATKAGFQSWQLGPRVLRTETAPVVMLALLQQRWGDF